MHEALATWLDDLRAAVMFLTRLPVRGQAAPLWPRLMRAFPLAGALIGALSAAVLVAAMWLNLGAWSAALLALAASVTITGALHEDGLADCCDALGARDRARRLDIMRDSRLGAFGVLGMIFAIALPVAALARIVEHAGAMAAAAALVSAHAVSRLAPIWLLHALPAARADGRGAEAGRPGWDVVLQAALAAAMVWTILFMPFAGKAAAAPLLAAALAAWMGARFALAAFGGQTGDVAGAAEVLARMAFLLAAAAMMG